MHLFELFGRHSQQEERMHLLQRNRSCGGSNGKYRTGRWLYLFASRVSGCLPKPMNRFMSWTLAAKATKILYKWLTHFRSNVRNMTKPLLGFQFLSYLFITQCACSLGLCFRKKDVLVRSILPFLMPAWSWNAAIPGSVRVSKDQRSTMFYYLP